MVAKSTKNGGICLGTLRYSGVALKMPDNRTEIDHLTSHSVSTIPPTAIPSLLYNLCSVPLPVSIYNYFRTNSKLVNS
jgi:hypothetical protein